MKHAVSRRVNLRLIFGIVIAVAAAVAAIVLFNVTEKPTSGGRQIPASAAEFLSNNNWYASGGPYSPRGPAAPLAKSWTLGTDRKIIRVSATDDMVYVYAKPDRLQAIDADTGETLWMFQRSDEKVAPEIRATSETVYISSADGFVYLLNARTGKRREKIAGDFSDFGSDQPEESDADWPIKTRAIFPPDAIALSRGETIFITSPEQPAPRFSNSGAPETQPIEKYLYAFALDSEAIWSLTALTRTLTVFNERTGGVAWTHEFVPNVSGIWSPVVTAEDVYVWKYKDVVSIDALTGSKNWSRAFKDGAPVLPVFTDNQVFIGSKDRLRVYNRQGEEVWSTGIQNSFPPIVRPDFLLIVSENPNGNITLNAFTARD